MKYDFIVFGGTGQQGKICARDLLESGYSVLLVGRDPSRIQDILKNKKAGFTRVDLRNQKDIVRAIKDSGADVVVNCAELTFNIAIMKACIETKKSCTDLGGLQTVTLKQFKMDKEFKKAGIINLTGCGSTPGISNVMTAYALKKFDKVDTIYLGFAWDSNIKKFVIPYSIQSIFEEFTEPPIVLYNGKFVKSNRMRCQGTFDFKEVGKQTVYCIVHSEVYTFWRYFKNKGVKNVDYMAGFPEHSFKEIKRMLKLGLNKPNKIDQTIKRLKKIKIPKNYKEKENLWVKIWGEKNGMKVEKEVNCIIKTVKGWEEAGSNVDTGRTISIMSQMIRNKLVKQKGVHSPEGVIPQERFFKELSKRKMYIYFDGRKIN